MRVLFAICLSTAAWSFSFGLSNPVISHWLQEHGADNTTIGLNHSTYYLGLALASLAVPWLWRRMGNACLGVGMILTGLSLALFPWAGGGVGWFLLRFINGMAGAMCLVPLETLISKDSDKLRRMRDFSFYGVALTLGAALGIGAGMLCYRPGETMAFYLGGLLPAAMGLFLTRSLPKAELEKSEKLPHEPLAWRRNFLGFGTGWFQGFLEGGLLAFLVLYLEGLGISQESAGVIMGITTAGVVLFQVPVAWLANRLGRLPVLLSCYAVVAVGLALMPIWAPSIWLVLCLFMMGACSGALFPLALAMLGDNLPPTALMQAYAVFLAMDCIGCLSGAAVMGAARDWWGPSSMFGVGLAALGVVLGGWLYLNRRLAFAPREEKT